MSKSLTSIEEKLAEVEQGSVREHILQSAKDFKSSWIEFGRALYSVWKDKLYKEWGYSKFEFYTAKEVGIKQQTALKLLRSYMFLEKEEPAYLKQEFIESAEAKNVPSYEAVDVLRSAKNRKVLDETDYSALKKQVFEDGREARDVKKDLTSMIRQREELEPQEAWDKKKNVQVKRLMSVLKSLRGELESEKMLPMPLLKELSELIVKLQEEVE
ncbi:MAG: hypothetical protein WBE75_07615 [Candidatus Omnitrophota bacterium]|jgi:hypothetical protein